MNNDQIVAGLYAIANYIGPICAFKVGQAVETAAPKIEMTAAEIPNHNKSINLTNFGEAKMATETYATLSSPIAQDVSEIEQCLKELTEAVNDLGHNANCLISRLSPVSRQTLCGGSDVAPSERSSPLGVQIQVVTDRIAAQNKLLISTMHQLAI